MSYVDDVHNFSICGSDISYSSKALDLSTIVTDNLIMDKHISIDITKKLIYIFVTLHLNFPMPYCIDPWLNNFANWNYCKILWQNSSSWLSNATMLYRFFEDFTGFLSSNILYLKSFVPQQRDKRRYLLFLSLNSYLAE